MGSPSRGEGEGGSGGGDATKSFIKQVNADLLVQGSRRGGAAERTGKGRLNFRSAVRKNINLRSSESSYVKGKESRPTGARRKPEVKGENGSIGGCHSWKRRVEEEIVQDPSYRREEGECGRSWRNWAFTVSQLSSVC